MTANCNPGTQWDNDKTERGYWIRRCKQIGAVVRKKDSTEELKRKWRKVNYLKAQLAYTPKETWRDKCRRLAQKLFRK